MPALRLLFVCVENANRSQMAQAFALLRGGGSVNAFSAGSRPSGEINPRAIQAMAELDYDLSLHRSTSLDEVPTGPFDAVITMGCGDACPHIPTTHNEDWSIPDPRDMSPEEFRQVRDLIDQKVQTLLNCLNGNVEQEST